MMHQECDLILATTETQSHTFPSQCSVTLMSVLVGNSAKVPCPFYTQNTAEQKIPICCMTLMLKSMTQKPYEDIRITFSPQ